MTVDREQVRRDAESLLCTPADLKRHCLALLAELEQAERTIHDERQKNEQMDRMLKAERRLKEQAEREREELAVFCAEETARLRDANLRLAAVPARVEALINEAEKQPLFVDISDYGDDFCEGFLRGQVNALQQFGAAYEQAQEQR